MSGFGRLALVEGRLFLREHAALLGVFGLPVALVIGFGLIPGFGDPQKGLSDQIGTEYIAAVGVAIVLASLGLTGVPMVIGQYRERGVLRRLAVTPVRPLTLLLADLMVWAAAGVVSVALVVSVVRFAFHVPAPVESGWFILSVVLGIASLFAVGPLAAAVAPTARSSAGIGWLLFFPNMFLAGIYFPTEEMSSTMRRVGITQLEAAQQTASESERDRRIGNAKRLARDSLAEARRSVQALRPQALEDSKLPDALADEVARWTATSGVPAEVRKTGDPGAAPRGRGDVAAGRSGGPGQRGQARRRRARLGHALLHGGRGEPRRPGRRRRVRPARGEPC
jgi:ABC-2 type transport system permease protein